MPFSAGTYTLPNPALVTGEIVSASENNTTRNDIAAAFNLTMLRNGTSTATANLPMGGYKLTGLGAATTNGDALSYGAAAVVTALTSTSLTATRVPYAGTGGLLQDASTFTFDGTTLTAGGFTTSGAVSAGTISASGNITVSGGTANGVAYLNGSKVLTSGSALTFDGTQIFKITGSPTVGPLFAVSDSVTTFGYVGSQKAVTGAGAIDTFIVSSANGKPLNLRSPSGQDISFDASGSEQMRLTSTGLGIGTSSPAEKLTVSGSASISSDLILKEGTTARGYIFGTSAGLTYRASSVPHVWQNGGTEQMRLDSSGNLGLGVTPSAWVSATGFDFSAVASLEGSSTQSIISANQYNANGTRIYKTTAAATFYRQTTGQHQWFTAPSGTAGNAISFTQAMTLVGSSDIKLSVGTTSNDGNAGYGSISVNGTNGSMFDAYAGGSLYGRVRASANQMALLSQGASTVLVLGTNNSENMRIDSSGNLLVGTTSATIAERLAVVFPNSGRGIRVQSNGTVAVDAMNFRNDNGQVGTIVTSGSSTAYNTSSDYRLKENIQPMQNALGVVAQLNPVTYNWKADGSDGQGFIAHELQAVVPDCVTGEKDAVDAEGKPVYQGIDTSFLVATLCKAIQELEARVKQLEGK